jgi:TolB-like protein
LRKAASLYWGERNIDPQEAGRLLNVDYVVSGLLRRHGKRLTVTAELMETRTNRIIWVEAYDDKLDNIFPVLDQICNNIVASIANEAR